MKHSHDFDKEPVGFEPLPPHPWWVGVIRVLLELTSIGLVMLAFGWLLFHEL